MTTDKPTLSIVIVNWNAGEALAQCLDSIAGASKDSFAIESVVIVDNASTDDSLGGIEKHSLPIHVLKNSENKGFAVACNQGASESHSDYLLFLNPDIVLEVNSIESAVSFMETRANIGICGIQLRNEMGEVSRTCGRFPTASRLISSALHLNAISTRAFQPIHMNDWDHKTSRQVDHVIGAFYLMRREVFAKLKGFDSRFFVYYEDLDFSLRAARAGWQSYYLASVFAFHEGGGSSKKVKAKRQFYSARSRILLARKHFPLVNAVAVSAVISILEPSVRVMGALLTGRVENAKNEASAGLMLWRSFKSRKASNDAIDEQAIVQ